MTDKATENHQTGPAVEGPRLSEGLGAGAGARRRLRTVERDPRGGWIARSVHTGAIYPSEDFRWNTRDGAWHAAWEARVLGGGRQ